MSAEPADPDLDMIGKAMAAQLWPAPERVAVPAPEPAEEEPPPAPVPPPRAGPTRRRLVLEWVAILAVALLVAVGLKVWVLQTYSIPSDSMVATLEVGDHILVNKLAYRTHDVRRGDVIVFTRPPALKVTTGPTPRELVKRVIGLPGDTVEARSGAVLVNGRRLVEPYLSVGTRTDRLASPVVVPRGQVFVMGDNRSVSADSRVFGTISEETIVGRAVVTLWPPNRVGFL